VKILTSLIITTTYAPASSKGGVEIAVSKPISPFLHINHCRLLRRRQPDKLADLVNQLLPVTQRRLLLLLALSGLHPELEPLPLLPQRREAPTVRGFLLAVTHFLLMLLGLFGELFSLPLSLPPS
jgi:hypothetical protein